MGVLWQALLPLARMGTRAILVEPLCWWGAEMGVVRPPPCFLPGLEWELSPILGALLLARLLAWFLPNHPMVALAVVVGRPWRSSIGAAMGMRVGLGATL